MLVLGAAVAATGATMPAFLHPPTSKFLHRRHRFIPHFFLRCSFSSAQVAVPNVVDIPLKVYCGFDPTEKSLHLGNLIGLIVLAWFQRCGHNIVALIGGVTAMIGDPAGRRIERPELDVETIEKNSAEVRALIDRILHRASKEIKLKMGCQKTGNSFLVMDNFAWWKEMKIKYFIDNLVIYATVGRMLANESVKKLLMSGEKINLNELMY